MNRPHLVIFLGATLLLMMCAATVSAKTQQPNFVVIFINDMGYGDIEPFSSTLNKTPQLNRMAGEGMKLTSFYSAAVFPFTRGPSRCVSKCSSPCCG